MTETTPKGMFGQREAECGQEWFDRLQQVEEASLSEEERKMLGRAKPCAWKKMGAESDLPLIRHILNRVDFMGVDISALHENDKPEPLFLVAEVISRLPEDVREWLLSHTRHVFICGYGQDGEYIDRFIPPECFPEKTQDGFLMERVIFLSEQLPSMEQDQALWTIAHEIAHSRLDHGSGGFDVEKQADAQVAEWGFTEPPARNLEREAYRHETRRQLNLEMIQQAATCLSPADLSRLAAWAQERIRQEGTS
jgi:hypothetical protein